MVERSLAKAEVAGSNPVSRSNIEGVSLLFLCAGTACSPRALKKLHLSEARLALRSSSCKEAPLGSAVKCIYLPRLVGNVLTADPRKTEQAQVGV